jgi:hypothetical protein
VISQNCIFLKIVKGFEIRYNDKPIKVAIKDGLLTVHLFSSNGGSPALADGESRMYIGGVDYEKCESWIWFGYFPIKIGDRFEIKVAEIDVPSAPFKVAEGKNIKRPKTKLEFFREVEVELKKQGLI